LDLVGFDLTGLMGFRLFGFDGGFWGGRVGMLESLEVELSLGFR